MPVRASKDKTLYQEKLGREISDATWLRVLNSIKSMTPEGVYDEKDLELYATLRKENPRLPVDLKEFSEVWKRIQDFKCGQTEYKGENFKKYLLRSLPYNLPLPTFYRWFQRAKMPFKASKMYKTEELLPIVGMAQCWFLKKKEQE